MRGSSRQFRIGIELIDDPAWMGGMLYLRNLAIGLSQLPESERPTVRLLGAAHVIERFLDGYEDRAIFEADAAGLVSRIRRRLGWAQKSAGSVDVVYPGFGSEVPGAVTVRWIPDFQHRYLPHLFSAEEIAARDRSIGEIAAKPGVVVLSSEVAAADFRKFYPGHTAVARVWRFHSRLDTRQPASRATVDRFELPEKYLYLPNQFWAHKNHITVLRALARLKRDRNLTIPLVCTGAQSDRRNEAHFMELVEFIKDAGLSDQVHLLGLIEREEQTEIFRHAASVVQPSLFEGWSTVVEDVRAVGRPIFLSDLPVHREQAPSRCFYFDPQSDEELAGLLAERWEQLPPGPDAEMERKSRAEMQGLLLNSAREFCDIARQAWKMGRADVDPLC
ncbi:glycosyltransferase [Rhizobium sp. R635]|uniref:glycosyltransferase n=1 Tax=Rhizobium sp. R635 TaxID=1764275 RepID=UPI000B5377E0|nr:glycosyltransferase [Rhizobium sp. R635]OWV92179.1 glycosyltransferase [Rhizobium sp. R635]